MIPDKGGTHIDGVRDANGRQPADHSLADPRDGEAGQDRRDRVRGQERAHALGSTGTDRQIGNWHPDGLGRRLSLTEVQADRARGEDEAQERDLRQHTALVGAEPGGQQPDQGVAHLPSGRQGGVEVLARLGQAVDLGGAGEHGYDAGFVFGQLLEHGERGLSGPLGGRPRTGG